MLRGRLLFGFLVGAAILTGRDQESAMSGDLDGPPTLSLQRPGLVTTSQVQPFALRQIYSYYLAPGRRLHTVQSFRGRDSEDRSFHSFDPVDWETTVPPGAQLFSVTAGISPDTTQQFWVGWLLGGDVYMEALTEHQAIRAPLTAGESLVFPGIMDAAGAASLFSWRPTADGAKLVRRTFAGTSFRESELAGIPGRPVVSRVAAVPGTPSIAFVGWVEDDESAGSSVLGSAIVEGGQAKVWRSHPILGTTPLATQRMGVWAATADRREVAAVVVSRGKGQTYRLARLSSTDGQAEGVPTSDLLALGPRQLASAVIDYAASASQPSGTKYFLLNDGRLLDGRLTTVRRDVPADSPLPLLGYYWVGRDADGRPTFMRHIVD